ncbi:hypothetical protein [Sphingopyxis solisilvae]|uniref:hypothetical protein n=1 Tax=Sphingopyxis solisilvae TaxID=1886788 RepID=UPI001892B617|nr:hypothetical protein [Sphingopyxis solisilvae]
MTDEATRAEETNTTLDWRWRSALVAGLLAGALDIVYILTIWTLMGVPQLTVLQVIASGIFGRSAFEGGMPFAAIGLGLHFFISILMAFAYFALVPAWLRAKPLLAGPAYGVALWLVMNAIVVPLSAAPISAPPAIILLADIAGHILLVGLPIAVLARTRACRGCCSCRT